MALEHLLAALERDATEQAEALLAKARAEAARIERETAEQAERRRREVLEPRTAERRAAVELSLGAAREAARRRVLEARHALLTRIFDAAGRRLAEAESSEVYQASLPVEFAAALECFEGRPVKVTCSPALAPKLKHDSVHVDSEITAGFRVAARDGSMEVDGTLGARLTRQRARLAVAILGELEEA